MKKFIALVLAAAAGFCGAYFIVSAQWQSRHANELANLQSGWSAEKADLENALATAKRKGSGSIRPEQQLTIQEVSSGPAKASPEQLIARLRALKSSSGALPNLTLRQAIHDFEELLAAGTSALPAIRDFLQSKEDLDFIAPNGKGIRGEVSADFVVPPTMRFGLFDVVKRIGGADAEHLLADMMNVTSRGIELVWLSRALEEMSPGGYRDAALASARRLIETPAAIEGKSNDREQAYKVLTSFKDAGYVSTAQGQLIRADGQVDSAALNYLLQTLGPQSVSLAAQLYDDPRITDPTKKEPFARVALNFVGADATANNFYVKAINDFGLSNEQRKNLIEDLNQDGFANRKALSENDLPLINNRMALIEQLVPTTTDPVNLTAMKEAYKDLVKMRERAMKPPAAK